MNWKYLNFINVDGEKRISLYRSGLCSHRWINSYNTRRSNQASTHHNNRIFTPMRYRQLHPANWEPKTGRHVCLLWIHSIGVISIYKFLVSTVRIELTSLTSKIRRITITPRQQKYFLKPAHGIWTPSPISTLSHHMNVASFFSIWSYDVLYHAGNPQPDISQDITWLHNIDNALSTNPWSRGWAGPLCLNVYN